MSDLKIAVTHASGMLAEALLQGMADSGVQSDRIVLLDNEQQVGSRLAYGDTYLTVQDQQEYDYENLIAVLLLEPDVELESLLQHADCFVVSHHTDGQSQEIFTAGLSELPQKPCAIKLASAELSSLLLVTNVLHSHYQISSLNVVNVLSSAVYGKSGVDELASQTISLLNSQDVKSSVLPLQLAFNMIPGEPEDGMEAQLQTAMQASDMTCNVQNILVPAFHGLSISVSLETVDPVNIEKISELFHAVEGVELSTEQTISPLTHCKTGSNVLITGLFQPQKKYNRLQFWLVADSVRNGLIQNYQNMLEILLKSYL